MPGTYRVHGISIGLIGVLTAPSAAQPAPGAGAMKPQTPQVHAVGQQTSRADAVRHSGRIVEVADDGSGIVLEEFVAWTGG